MGWATAMIDCLELCTRQLARAACQRLLCRGNSIRRPSKLLVDETRPLLKDCTTLA